MQCLWQSELLSVLTLAMWGSQPGVLVAIAIVMSGSTAGFSLKSFYPCPVRQLVVIHLSSWEILLIKQQHVCWDGTSLPIHCCHILSSSLGFAVLPHMPCHSNIWLIFTAILSVQLLHPSVLFRQIWWNCFTNTSAWLLFQALSKTNSQLFKI